jgi:hypothetical protein
MEKDIEIRKDKTRHDNDRMQMNRTRVLGMYLLIMAIGITYFIFQLWPNFTIDDSGKVLYDKTFYLFAQQFTMENESRWILIVLLTGALGSYVHATTSFVTFVGNRSLVTSWTWWYILRPFIGSSLALIFYFVIRGGLLSTGTEAANVSIFGIAAISGMVGMFSKQATDKLKELFDTLFKTKEGQGDDVRADKLGDKIPVKDKMIPLNMIKTFVLPEGKPVKEIKLKEFYDLLQGSITRLPVLDNKNVVKYIIHQSMLYKFIADQSLIPGKAAADISVLNFEDFLNEPVMKEFVTESIAFISEKATLGEAKEKMESVKNCQDVFITENGKSTEPITGWITNVEIGKHLKG